MQSPWKTLYLIFAVALIGNPLIAQIPGNWGFENSIPPASVKHWKFGYVGPFLMYVDSTGAFEKSKCVMIFNASKSVNHKNYATIQTNFQLPRSLLRGKQKLTVSAYLRTEAMSDSGSAYIYANAINAEGKNIGHENSLEQGKHFATWQKVSFTIPVDSTGTSINLGGVLMGGGQARFDQFELSLDGQPLEDTDAAAIPMNATELSELQKAIVPLPDLSTGKNQAAFKKLWQPIGQHGRIIGLGEATHGNREFVQLRQQLIRWLAEDQQQDLVFVLEEAFGSTYNLNHYLMGGQVEIAEEMRKNIGGVWQVKEMAELLKWMRQHNATHARKIRFYGNDMQWSFREVLSLIEFGRTQSTDFQVLVGQLATADSAFQKAPTNAMLRDSLVKSIHRLERSYATMPTSEEKSFRLQQLEVLRQNIGRKKLINKGSASPYYRDSCMAANVLWLANQFPAKKVLLWAHNGHLGKSGSGMGRYLHEAFKDEYVVVATTTATGTYRAYNNKQSFITAPLKAPFPETYEHWFAQVPSPTFGIHLRQLPAKHWLRQPHHFRAVSFMETPYQFSEHDLLSNYDLVLFTRTATSTTSL